MGNKQQADKFEIYIMTDEEFYAAQAKKKKESLLDSLLQVSDKTPSFSVKDIKSTKKESEFGKRQEPEPGSAGSLNTIFDKIENDTEPISDEEWSSILDQISDINQAESPIEDIADQRMTGYRLADAYSDPENRYANMFKKELAMLSEVLKDSSSQTKILSKKLSDMTSKSQYSGVSKYYSDMLNAFNSLNSTRSSIIKTMADLRAKQEDFRLKEKKDKAEDAQSTDALVDQFYKQIINGGRSNFVDQAMSTYQPITNNNTSSTELSDDILSEGYNASGRFNITQMDEYNTANQPNLDTSNIDPYGYIANEKNDVDICVQRFSNGDYAFIAIDGDGNVVDNYELPGDDLLNSLDIKPYSNFASDKFQRRYRIIDVNTEGVPLDDLDDDDYPGYDNSSREDD